MTFQGNEVRIVNLNGEPYWCALDVCNVLGYKRGRDAIAQHCKSKGAMKHRTLTNGGEQDLTYIDEGNVFRLVMKSVLPETEKFQDWVHDEVLPQIRKTGAYSLPNAIPQNSDDQILLLCANLTEKIHECRRLNSQIAENQPKVESFNAFIDTTDLITVRNAAGRQAVADNLNYRYGTLTDKISGRLPVSADERDKIMQTFRKISK